MDIVLIPQHWSAILCICIMIGALLFAYAKKLMMTYALLIANVVIFILTIIYTNEIIYGVGSGVYVNQFPLGGLGFRSIYLTPEYSPQIYTIFTSMFIHGGFAHIFGNMFIFLFIGMAFEQRIGWKKFVIIYLVTGICGSLTHSLLDLGSEIPLIGASGAIFGIMGAFAYSHPWDEVVMPIPIGIMLITRVKVLYAVILFAIMETLIVWWESQTGYQSSTAHFAHLGGLASGVILAAILIRRKKAEDSVSFKTVYYDSFAPPKPSKKDFSTLRQLANTPELKNMLNKIENETLPQVRDVWLERFFEKAVCPKCKNPLHHFDNKVWCEYCGYRTSY